MSESELTFDETVIELEADNLMLSVELWFDLEEAEECNVPESAVTVNDGNDDGLMLNVTLDVTTEIETSELRTTELEMSEIALDKTLDETTEIATSEETLDGTLDGVTKVSLCDSRETVSDTGTEEETDGTSTGLELDEAAVLSIVEIKSEVPLALLVVDVIEQCFADEVGIKFSIFE